ncbi:hypothetical protein ACQP00_09930 [Dactylosporangium sp. CS-047395]|uniref:hypothetical protein n=1 Tax=Dactylosporangium sp. CS-047395 TaxID=3239936 RepID=UPI003D9377D4
MANGALEDCLAATVLVRLAVSVADDGVAAALERHRDGIATEARRMDGEQAGRAARHVPGLTGLPARPGVILRDIERHVERHLPGRARDETFVRTAIANAGAYGRLAHDNAYSLLREMIEVPDAPGRGDAIAWAAQPMERWRPTPERARWEQPPLFELEPGPERVGNMVWLAELGDALAQLYWCAPATVEYGRIPDVSWNLADDEASPLAPRWDSIALVAAGTAQLAGLAGPRPGVARARTWPELIAALQAGAAVTEALTGAFPVPEGVLATDGTTLPGGDEVIEIARTPRQTVAWGTFMGNCIGGSWYTDSALDGKAFLVALRAPGGRILANVDIRPSARGWRIDELRGRFNQDPEPELAARVRAWVAALAPPPARPDEVREPRAGRVHRRPRTPAARITREHGPALGELAAAAVLEPGTEAAVAVLGRLLDTPEMTALRRVSPAGLTRAVVAALDDGRLTAGEAWRAGGARPMSAALAGYGHPDLAPLALDEPLPGSLRTVARAPGIAEARTTELVARRVRRALGTLLRTDAPALTARRPDGLDEPMLCACTLAVTTWAGPGVPVAEPRRVTVPGFPVTRLNEGPWEAAWPDAAELGADRETFWEHVAAHGLLVPAGWLGPSGWPGLWNQAHRN